MSAHHDQDAKVIELPNKTVAVDETEMERRRKITFRAFEIAGKQLEADALRMEQQAIIGEAHTIQRRHELMDSARCLRVATGWLQQLAAPQPEPKNA